MKNLFLVILLISLCSFITACKKERNASDIPEKPLYSFRHDGILEVRSADGKYKATFNIEIVEKEAEVTRGLKFREHMEPDQAMLFVFSDVDYYPFWMQDTYMSLDMLFIDQNNSITQIEENTTPFSEEQIYPQKPHKYVLEVLAGTVKNLNIQTTDTVIWHYKKD